MNKLKAFAVLAGLGFGSPGSAQDMPLPPTRTQETVRAIVNEHIDALNRCDWNRVMAQFPDDVTFMMPNGAISQGRQRIGELFAGFCKSRSEGGFKGAKLIPEATVEVGNTVSVSWRIEADYLAEAYRGADAYLTRDGLLAAQVTTFDPNQMKFR
ncbi:nuclear transport factor 2 family protein [Rhizobium leguminosarum]